MVFKAYSSDFEFLKQKIIVKFLFYQFLVLSGQVFLLLIWPDLHSASIGSLLLGVSSAIFLVVQIILSRHYRLLLFTFVGFTLAPIWFLYLDGILPSGVSYTLSSPHAKQYIAIYSTIFLLTFTLFYRLPFVSRIVRFLPRPAYPNITSKTLLILTITSFLVPIILIGIIQHGGSWDAIAYSLTAGRDGFGSGILLRSDGFAGSEYNVLQPLIWIFLFTPSFFALSVSENILSLKLIALRSIGFLCAASVLLFAFLSGDRNTLITVSVPMMIIGLSRFLNSKKRFYIFLILLPILISCIANLNQLQVRYRGNILDQIQTQAAYSREFEDLFIDSNLYIASLVVEKVPSEVPYLGFKKLIEPLINLVPRFIWKSKPVSHEDPTVFNLFNSGTISFGTPSLTLSIIGTLYLYGGLPAIFIAAPLFSVIFAFFDQLHFDSNYQYIPVSKLTTAISFPASVWSFRSYAAIINVTLPIFFLLSLGMIYKMISRSNFRSSR